MKKQITLLSGLLVFSVAFGQAIKTNSQPMAKKQMGIHTGKIMSSPVADEEKNPGDIIWSNDFSNPANWTFTTVGPGIVDADHGWQITSTKKPWAFSSIINSTGGAPYALCLNGDPTSGSPAVTTGTEWIMTYNADIDLSAETDVAFEFQQYGALFIESQVVEVSKDGGATWVEIGNNDDMGSLTAGGGSAYANPTNRHYNVSQAVGAMTTTMRFRFRVSWPSGSGANDGIMYGWYVDNVKFVEGFQNDLKLQDLYPMAGTQEIKYTKFQKDQAGTAAITFSGWEQNNASNSQNSILTVTGPSFSATTASPVVIPGYTEDTLVTSPAFTIPSALGTTAFTAVLTSNNNTLDNTADDTQAYNIEVTNEDMGVDSYSNAASITGSFIGWASGTGDPGIGTFIEIFNATDAINVKVGIANISGATQQANYVGHGFYGKLHVYNAVTDAFDYVDQTPTHDIVAADFGNLVTLGFSSPVALTPGLYLVTAGFSSTEDCPIAFSGFIPQGQTVGWDGTSMVNLIGNSSYHKMVEAPVVRLGVSNSASIKESSLVSDVAIYPNPFVGTTDIKLNLKNDATVSAIVTDLAGRTVATVPAKNVANGEHTISINGTNFQAGMYNVVLTVGGETITKRIVKN